ncbi:hypothetical protein MSVAZ_2003 [Methanosarcina vacuolata Z-761]|uniref:Uncharacterized protein n=2 Tax=Methanosarcina vacuolata TaxID=2215 RepID=A0A0E3Q6D6_9EURY|nr:hypothetical protein MSVAZ_2003 [Methanosarcina vacuolata Z-761]
MAESVEMVENKENAPVFCEKYCIVCKGAREGNKICKAIQNIELKIFGKNGCIWGAARTKYYGVTPDKKLPVNSKNKQKQNGRRK